MRFQKCRPEAREAAAPPSALVASWDLPPGKASPPSHSPTPAPGLPVAQRGAGALRQVPVGGGAAWCCRAAGAVGWLRPQAPVFWTSWPVTESGKAGHGGKRGGWPPEAPRAEPAFGGPYSSRRVLMKDDVSSEASMGLFGEEEECCVQSGAGSAKQGAHIPEGVEDSPWGPGKGVFRLMFPFNEGEICAALSTSMPMNSGP